MRNRWELRSIYVLWSLQSFSLAVAIASRLFPENRRYWIYRLSEMKFVYKSARYSCNWCFIPACSFIICWVAALFLFKCFNGWNISWRWWLFIVVGCLSRCKSDHTHLPSIMFMGVAVHPLRQFTMTAWLPWLMHCSKDIMQPFSLTARFSIDFSPQKICLLSI